MGRQTTVLYINEVTITSLLKGLSLIKDNRYCYHITGIKSAFWVIQRKPDGLGWKVSLLPVCLEYAQSTGISSAEKKVSPIKEWIFISNDCDKQTWEWS